MRARLLSDQVGFVTEKVVLLIFPEPRSAYHQRTTGLNALSHAKTASAGSSGVRTGSREKSDKPTDISGLARIRPHYRMRKRPNERSDRITAGRLHAQICAGQAAGPMLHRPPGQLRRQRSDDLLELARRIRGVGVRDVIRNGMKPGCGMQPGFSRWKPQDRV
jgi:hypothetical protein